ncbi:unnamed protein product, partial [Rotaria sordida]
LNYHSSNSTTIPERFIHIADMKQNIRLSRTAET